MKKNVSCASIRLMPINSFSADIIINYMKRRFAAIILLHTSNMKTNYARFLIMRFAFLLFIHLTMLREKFAHERKLLEEEKHEENR